MQETTFNQLMLLPSDELTDSQREFVTVHNEMVMAGQKASECLLIVVTDLKRMKDEELYKAAGFETFTDYVETALNIKERQARKWISILKLPDEYLVKNSKMGLSKLALISEASEPIAEELMNAEGTADKSVNELKELIKERDAALKKLEAADGKVADLERERDEAEDSRAELQRIYDEKKQELIKAKDAVKELEAKLKDVKPEKETVTVIDETSVKEAKEQRARADEYEKLVDEQKKQVEELEQQIKDVTAQLTVAKEQKKAIASDDLLLFKVKYEDLQRIGQDLMSLFKKMKPENAAKCKKALSTVIQEWAEDMAS